MYTMVIRTLTFNDIVIEARESDHFINATQMCKAGGKLFADWYRLKTTAELIAVLGKDLQKSNMNIAILDLIDKKVGGDHSGTCVHPDLAVQLAQWISPVFAIQVSRWVRELTTTGHVSLDNPTRTDEELKEMERRAFEAEEALAEQKRIAEEQRCIVEEQAAAIEKMKKVIKAISLTDAGLDELTKDEFMYIATTDVYAGMSRFKVGGTINLKKRLCNYNSSHTIGDPFYFCYIARCNDFAVIEATMKQLLRPYLDKKDSTKEMYNVHYDHLLYILNTTIQLNNALVDHVNDIREDLFESTVGDAAAAPKKVLLGDVVEPSFDLNLLKPAEFNRDELLDRVFTSPPEAKVYVDDATIKYGYNGSSNKNNRVSFTKHLNSDTFDFEKGVDFWIFDNKEYEQAYADEFEDVDGFPDLGNFIGVNGMSRCLHIVTTASCLGQVLLSARNGDYNREYCMRLARSSGG